MTSGSRGEVGVAPPPRPRLARPPLRTGASEDLELLSALGELVGAHPHALALVDVLALLPAQLPLPAARARQTAATKLWLDLAAARSPQCLLWTDARASRRTGDGRRLRGAFGGRRRACERLLPLAAAAAAQLRRSATSLEPAMLACRGAPRSPPRRPRPPARPSLLAFFPLAAALLLLAAPCTAHMELSSPPAIYSKSDPQTAEANKDYSMTSPLEKDGSNWPAKGRATKDIVDGIEPVATLVAGDDFSWDLAGTATHNGSVSSSSSLGFAPPFAHELTRSLAHALRGSCQVGVSYDYMETQVVIASWIGDCPLKKCVARAALDLPVLSRADSHDCAQAVHVQGPRGAAWVLQVCVLFISLRARRPQLARTGLRLDRRQELTLPPPQQASSSGPGSTRRATARCTRTCVPLFPPLVVLAARSLPLLARRRPSSRSAAPRPRSRARRRSV